MKPKFPGIEGSEHEPIQALQHLTTSVHAEVTTPLEVIEAGLSSQTPYPELGPIFERAIALMEKKLEALHAGRKRTEVRSALSALNRAHAAYLQEVATNHPHCTHGDHPGRNQHGRKVA